MFPLKIQEKRTKEKYLFEEANRNNCVQTNDGYSIYKEALNQATGEKKLSMQNIL